MNSSYPSDRDRLLELLADQAIAGLNADQQRELKSLLQSNPDFDLAAIDRTAAMLDIAASAVDIEPLPDRLRDRILAQDQSALRTHVKLASAAQPRNEIQWREVVAWITAAVCLLLAVFAWSRWPATNAPPGPSLYPPTVAENDQSPMRTHQPDNVRPNTAPTVAELREQLVASADDVLHLQLVSNDSGDVAGAPGGDIVWSSGRQMGYLRLHGLTSKDRAQRQFQLWIVSSAGSGNEIINGGLFHVDQSTGNLILPIQADQFIEQPKMFVVDVEPLGGGEASHGSLLAKADGVGR